MTLDLDFENWRFQGFQFDSVLILFFNSEPSQGIPVGLTQLKNGPCGVLASVQALLARELIFVNKLWVTSAQPPSSYAVEEALYRALSQTLTRAVGPGAPCTVFIFLVIVS
jgi:hypothetical protein